MLNLKRLLVLSVSLLAGCSLNASPAHNVLIIAESGSKKDLEFAQSIVDTATKELSEESRFTLGTLDSDGLHLLWSSEFDEPKIRKITRSLKVSGHASSTALIHAYGLIGTVCQTDRDRPLKAILVTSGTQDAATLNSLRAIARTSLSPCTNLNVAVVGLTPNNSLKTVATLNSIRDRVRSGRVAEGVDGESMNVVRSFLEE